MDRPRPRWFERLPASASDRVALAIVALVGIEAARFILDILMPLYGYAVWLLRTVWNLAKVVL